MSIICVTVYCMCVGIFDKSLTETERQSNNKKKNEPKYVSGIYSWIFIKYSTTILL